MTTDQDSLTLQIQNLLGKKITHFILKGKGACNNAYYIETENGGKYIVKQERDVKEFQPQNDLVVEAGVAERLLALDLSIPTPQVVFVSENPKMYGYKYIEGDLMRGVWPSLVETDKMSVCQALGRWHAEIGKKFTREMAEACHITIDTSPDIHPEVLADYNRLILSTDIPEDFKILAKEAKSIFDGTMDKMKFQFIHNDSHHENIIIKDKSVSGIIDFGNAEHGEIAKEFSRYIRDYPDYFTYIVSAYEAASESKLCYERLVSHALLCDFIDIVENYQKGEKSRVEAEESIANYRKLLHK